MNRKNTEQNLFLLILFFIFFSTDSFARENMGFLAEHLVEAAQDARSFVLPWADDTVPSKNWKPIVTAAAVEVGVGFAQLRGQLFSLGASHTWSQQWACQIFIFHDQFELYGDQGEELISGSTLANVPLDLPASALLSPDAGMIQHLGVTIAGIRRWKTGQAAWSMTSGVQLGRFKTVDFRFKYQLVDGADRGSEGIIDYSSTHYFLSPFVGVQYQHRLSTRLSILPRISIGAPLNKGQFDTRMSGANFDVSTDSPGAKAENLGDGFITLGVGIRDRKTGLEFDIGSLFLYAPVEDITHPGVDRSVLLSISWYGQ